MTAPPGRPLPTSTPAPTRSAPPTTRRTGIAGVDAVIDAMHADDSKTLSRVIQLSPMPCSTRGGIGGPPGCVFGLADGTIVHAIPMAGCEGGVASDVSGIMAGLNRIAEARPELYAVYRAPADYFGLAFAGIDLGLEYVAVFAYSAPAGQTGIAVAVRGDKAVGFKHGCATGRYAPSDMVPAGTPVVLAPA
jgi:hypothetical protein